MWLDAGLCSPVSSSTQGPVILSPACMGGPARTRTRARALPAAAWQAGEAPSVRTVGIFVHLSGRTGRLMGARREGRAKPLAGGGGRGRVLGTPPARPSCPLQCYDPLSLCPPLGVPPSWPSPPSVRITRCAWRWSSEPWSLKDCCCTTAMRVARTSWHWHCLVGGFSSGTERAGPGSGGRGLSGADAQWAGWGIPGNLWVAPDQIVGGARPGL